MKNVMGFIKIELVNGKELEFLNEKGLKVKNDIIEKFMNGEKTFFENEEIRDIHYSFVSDSEGDYCRNERRKQK